jgi:hypothetical protein
MGLFSNLVGQAGAYGRGAGTQASQAQPTNHAIQANLAVGSGKHEAVDAAKAEHGLPVKTDRKVQDPSESAGRS